MATVELREDERRALVEAIDAEIERNSHYPFSPRVEALKSAREKLGQVADAPPTRRPKGS